MELILAPESAPFTGAIIFVIFLATLEALSLLIGASLSGLFDHLSALHIDIDANADAGLGWLHLGKVPVLVLLVLFLTAFAITGFACNGLFFKMTGAYPPVALSVIIALLSGVLIVRRCGSVLVRVMPKDESSAVALSSLVGHVAIIVNGTARKDYPAQARVTTEKGQTFYVRVEPESDSERFDANDSVLLVKQISGTRFLVCANPHPELL